LHKYKQTTKLSSLYHFKFLILATVSAIYLFIWIGRKSYYMVNPSEKKILIVPKK